MKLSTKGRYAMVALADLANAKTDDMVSLAAISKRQDISLPYLEQLFVKLRRSGLVEAVRGPGGGSDWRAAPILFGSAKYCRRWKKPLTRCTRAQAHPAAYRGHGNNP